MTLRALPLPAVCFAAALAVSGCVLPPDAGTPTTRTGQPATPPTGQKIAVLVPLTGPNATLGRDLLRAVQLALGPDGPQADVQDTGGTPTGATMAARAAVAAGDGIIVGPLTAPETAAVAAVAVGTPILAFTSDRQQGRPGVWALGITPQQQVIRMVRALSQRGKTRVAAALPDNIFGNALADGLTIATSDVGDPPPSIKRYPDGRPGAVDAALRDLTDAGRSAADPAASTEATPRPAAPPPFSALLLGESGPAVGRMAAALPGLGVTPPAVQVIGPATWARDAAGQGGLAGAWYAAPDPAFRTKFEQSYAAQYGAPPPGFADIAYDAAQLARLALGNTATLTQVNGFRGVDGLFALRPDGQVARGLAVFAVGPGGARIVDPAPASIAPGS